MMRTTAIAVIMVGCVGGAPVDRTVPDGGGDAGDGAGGGGGGETARLAGRTLDHFVPATAIVEAAVTTDGIAPPVSATSSIDGDYVLEPIPVGSRLIVTAARAGYRPTASAVAVDAPGELLHDLRLVSIADARRQYVTLGRLPAAGTAIAIATIEDAAGQPLAGVALAQLALVDAAGAPVPGVRGPYAFGAAGDVDPAATATVGGAGRARVAFLDVPPGPAAVRLGTARASIVAAPDGAVVATLRAGDAAPPDVMNPQFARDVHPRLQTAANGGLGCTNCHTLGGSGGVLELDGPADLVRDRLLAKPGLVDPANPPASALLVRPLYEVGAAPDHPNATFLDAGDPDYQLIRRWIVNGAGL